MCECPSSCTQSKRTRRVANKPRSGVPQRRSDVHAWLRYPDCKSIVMSRWRAARHIWPSARLSLNTRYEGVHRVIFVPKSVCLFCWHLKCTQQVTLSGTGLMRVNAGAWSVCYDCGGISQRCGTSLDRTFMLINLTGGGIALFVSMAPPVTWTGSVDVSFIFGHASHPPRPTDLFAICKIPYGSYGKQQLQNNSDSESV